MKKLIIYSVIVFIIISILGRLSFNLLDADGKVRLFWSNLLLNLVAEFLGLALGIILPLIVAYKFAGKRLDRLARPIVELIAQLRDDKTISPDAARKCVVCAVKLISEDHMKQKSISLSLAFKKDICEVCTLPIETGSDKRCEYCGLQDHIWKLKGKPDEG